MWGIICIILSIAFAFFISPIIIMAGAMGTDDYKGMTKGIKIFCTFIILSAIFIPLILFSFGIYLIL